jgi:hypothetical protein
MRKLALLSYPPDMEGGVLTERLLHCLITSQQSQISTVFYAPEPRADNFVLDFVRLFNKISLTRQQRCEEERIPAALRAVPRLKQDQILGPLSRIIDDQSVQEEAEFISFSSVLLRRRVISKQISYSEACHDFLKREILQKMGQGHSALVVARRPVLEIGLGVRYSLTTTLEFPKVRFLIEDEEGNISLADT